MMIRKNRRRFRPVLNSLEGRVVLSTYGNPWPNPDHISISFAPDGTQDGLQTSSLFQTLSGLNNGGNDWQLTMLRAFQTWATEADINFSLTTDNGLAFGTTGAIQDDPRFGDIRVGAIAQTPVTMALTQPFSYASGTWAGDVNLNSTQPFGINGSGGADLFTVALHEAGHSLGLVDNNDPSSIMDTTYNGPKTGLSATDIAAIQAIYGTSTDTPNTSFRTASPIVPVSVFTSPLAPIGVTTGRLATSTSSDYFVMNSGTTMGPLQVQLQTSGISLLDARLTVYDTNHNVIASATAADPRNGNLAITLPGFSANTNYYISITGAHGDVFGVGDYQLEVVPNAIIQANARVVSSVESLLGSVSLIDNNTSFSTASSLDTSFASVGPLNYYIASSLSVVGQSRYYSFPTPSTIPSGTKDVMTVAVWGTDLLPLDAMATIYDAHQNLVASTIIRHENGSYVIQVPNAALNATDFVKITDYDTNLVTSQGNFGLSVAFASSVEAQTQLSGGTFIQSGQGFNAQSSSTMTLDHDTLTNFLLSGSNGGPNQDVDVTMTLTDASGNVVATLQTRVNQSQSLEIWLKAGSYKVSYGAVNHGYFAASPLKWSLATEDLSDPIKVYSSPGPGSSKPR